MSNEKTSRETPKRGITTDDRERIREYLAKPPHLRSERDLLPDESDSED